MTQKFGSQKFGTQNVAGSKAAHGKNSKPSLPSSTIIVMGLISLMVVLTGLALVFSGYVSFLHVAIGISLYAIILSVFGNKNL